MGIKQAIISQGVRPHGLAGWPTAWIMRAFSDSYCGDLSGLLNLQAEDELLEVACGAGDFLYKRGAPARYIAGLDHSDIQLRMARKRNRERIEAGTAEIVKGDSAALPWPDARFSAVTCNCVGCFAQPAKSLAEMYRVLRPGGRAAFSFDLYPDEQSARRAEQSSGLPAWTQNEAQAVLEGAGYSGVTFSRSPHNLFVAAEKRA